MSKASHEKAYRKAYYESHKEKCRASSKAWASRNREKMNAYVRAYRQKPEVKAKIKARLATPEAKAKRLEYERAYREKHREQSRATALAWRSRNRVEANAHSLAWSKKPEVEARRKERLASPEGRVLTEVSKKNRYHRLRIQALELYGGKCACCGESHQEFLVFDHINGGGKADRMKIGNGVRWYFYLVNNHPDHIRILCQNCNSALGHYGQCPHQAMKGNA